MPTEKIHNSISPHDLLIFIGHGEDAEQESEAIRSLESELQSKLDEYVSVSPQESKYSRLRFWEWKNNASHEIGGQDEKITPNLERADIAVFVFKEKIGRVTWEELDFVRKKKKAVMIAVFPKFLDPSKMRDLQAIDNWKELVEKQNELSDDWIHSNSVSLTPVDNYKDENDLKVIMLDEISKAIKSIIRKSHEKSSNQPSIIKTNEWSSYKSSVLHLHCHLITGGYKTKILTPIELEKVYVGMKAKIHSTDYEYTKAGMQQLRDQFEKEKTRPLNLRAAINAAKSRKIKSFVILGNPGCGKTILLKYLLVILTQGGAQQQGGS